MPNALQSKLNSGTPAYGVWCAINHLATIEAIGTRDADWILIDCEHGMASADACMPYLQALAASDAAALVRLPKADPSLAARVLDAGANGIIVPQVHSPEIARQMVAACRYPPVGTRGVGPHRATAYFTKAAEYFQNANTDISVVVQIESQQAVEAIDDILAVEGLEAVFIGPADLSASLGHFGNPAAESVKQAVAHVLERAQAAGVPAGYYCNSAKEARSKVEQGFLMVNVAHDLGSLLAGVSRALATAKGN